VSPSDRGFIARAVIGHAQKQGRPPTILEYSLIKVGFRRGTQAVFALVMFTICRRRDGQEPDWQTYGETTHMSRAAAFKHLAMLREVWGEHLSAAADALEEATGPALDELMAVAGDGDRKPQDIALVFGTVPAPSVVAA
jgi:hypothetical protein